jgi:hypothetical protein
VKSAATDKSAAHTPSDEEIRKLAMKGLLSTAQLNEGEPCWCPLWWWEEQTGPSEGEHTEHCDKQRLIYVALGGNT